jgi:hypothetical protein
VAREQHKLAVTPAADVVGARRERTLVRLADISSRIVAAEERHLRPVLLLGLANARLSALYWQAVINLWATQ